MSLANTNSSNYNTLNIDDIWSTIKNDKEFNPWDSFKEKTNMIMDTSGEDEDEHLELGEEERQVNLEENTNSDYDDDYLDDDSDLCSDCKTPTLVYADGQYVCQKCGLMQCKKLFEEAEYRNYGDGGGASKERVGMPTNSMLPESSLGTLISQRSHDNNSVKRMVQYNSWHQMPYKERSLYKICCKITNKTKRYGLPAIIIERAKEFYNIIRDVNISRGDNRDGLIAACVYFACKDEKVPRSSKEIADMFDIQLQDMTKGIKNFRENWRMAQKNGEHITDDSSNPIDYIERYCSNLPVSTDVKHIAEFIAVKALFSNIVDDNTAPSIAAGSIFLASQIASQNVTKKQVADACKTSEVTISKCYKKLNEKKMELLPKAVIAKYNIIE